MDALIQLLALRARLALRPRGGRGAIGSVLLAAKALVFVPTAILIAVAVYGLVASADATSALTVVGRLLLGIQVGWILFPLLGLHPGPFRDPARLAPFPLSRTTLFTASALESMTLGPIVFVAPAILAAAVALPGSPTDTLLRVALAVLFLAQGAMLMQALATAFGRVLRSRRFHDLSAVLISVVCVALYFLVRGAFASAPESASFAEVALGGTLPGWAAFLPSGLAAHALVDLGASSPIRFLGESALLLTLTALAAAVGFRALGRALQGELGGGGPAPARANDTGRRSVFAPLTAWIPASARAFATKEIRLLRREPLVKAQLIVQSGFLLLPLIASFAFGPEPTGRAAHVLPEVLLAALSFSVVVVQGTLLLNMFGLEGTGFAQLLAMPLPRKRLLLLKNAFYFVLFGTLNAIGLALFCVALRVSYGTPTQVLLVDFVRFVAVNWALLALSISVGNLTSVLFPVRLTSMGCNALGIENAGAESLSRLLLRGVVTTAILILMLPLAAVLLIPGSGLLGVGFGFLALALPVVGIALAFSHATSVHLAARLLGQRESELVDYFAGAA